ncbi:hypothetical protein B0T26DRAFT_689717 [Lasiosphaeria miniovina]|uniref:Clr5 domain-containing protein n=1 Tax=Lasiosphaeria miniovina TaxID=1954250 RepID=A0AA40BIG3_9PEZI|nr:uncharacterized protein B0T26DRAFT_689717 [Lasiosphaeria miniovina]KAK0734818.1 hypothetical protein B0T26DRAFT_689717 [Lasiosphaeria miniovina]
MGYDWEAHKQACHQLYIVENRSLDDLVELMRLRHNFTPCRRAFQLQLRRWGFPEKPSQAYKYAHLVDRVRELWESNLNQKDMLSALHAEGVNIKDNTLMRMRTKFGFYLRDLGGLANPITFTNGVPSKAKAGTKRRRAETDASGSGDESDESESESDSGSSGSPEEESGSGDNDTISRGLQQSRTAPARPVDHAAQQARREARKRALEAKSIEDWATKKRRRRSKGWAGMPADPGPPRFPSETSLSECKVILQIDENAYREIRNSFQALCEAAGVAKKTVAGPEKWEALKDQLVRESIPLRSVMWDPDNMEQKRLAIDVIANDVTKRIRTLSKAMSIAQAKTILGMNPEVGREFRSSLYRMLARENFTTKYEEGLEYWEDIKTRWLTSSKLWEHLLTLSPETDLDYPTKKRALDLLARDALRRYRFDLNQREKKARAPPPEPQAEPARAGNAGAARGRPRGRGGRTAGPSRPAAAADTRQTMPAATLSPQRSRRAAGAATSLHTEPRLLPPDADPAPPPQHAAAHPQPDPDLASMHEAALLLSAETNIDPFLEQEQYGHGGYQAHQPAAPQQSAAIAVYFRLHPASAVHVVTGSIWISALDTRTIDELRGRALEKYPGAVCAGIQGIIKDGKGVDLPLPVNDDGELDAYFQHVQGVCAPTFSVQLMSGEQGHW